MIKSNALKAWKNCLRFDEVINGGSAGGTTGTQDEAQTFIKSGGRSVVTAVTMETGYTILKELKGRPSIL